MASFAQERLFLDEKFRFSDQIAIYNEMMVLRVSQGGLSINRFQAALRFILSKHKILRTSLGFNSDDGTLRQSITDSHQTFTLALGQSYRNDDELCKIVHQLMIDPHLFDLSTGRVFHCEILRQEHNMNDENELKESDVIVMVFHHAANDRTSRQVFHTDLSMAYNDHLTTAMNEEAFEYIDYSIHERLIDMTVSRDFWKSEVEGYNRENSLLLPGDRHHSVADQRSGLAFFGHISFADEVTAQFLKYASIHEVTPFQLGLAIFYAFVFKFTHDRNDLCIACLNANRYRNELQNMIGMFVTTSPYRIRLDSQWTLETLVQHVREKSLAILEHAHYPLQHMHVNSSVEQSHALFLEVVFDFITLSSHTSHLSFNGAQLEPISPEKSDEVAKFDVMLRFLYNPADDNGKLFCRLICSRDLFDEPTVAIMTRRFEHLVSQLFSSASPANETEKSLIPISKLSLILPEEVQEIQRTNFHRQTNIVQEGMSITELFWTISNSRCGLSVSQTPKALFYHCGL